MSRDAYGSEAPSLVVGRREVRDTCQCYAGLLRCRFAFAIARSALVCLRGSRSGFQGVNEDLLVRRPPRIPKFGLGNDPKFPNSDFWDSDIEPNYYQ